MRTRKIDSAPTKALIEVERHAKGEVSLKETVVCVPDVDVKEIRASTRLTQREFALRYGLTLDAVQNWEQRLRVPEGPARVLLLLIQIDPKLVARQLKKVFNAPAAEEAHGRIRRQKT